MPERFLKGEMKALPPSAGVGGVPCPPSPIVSLSAAVENEDGVSLDQQKVSAQKPKRGAGGERELNPLCVRENTMGFLHRLTEWVGCS